MIKKYMYLAIGAPLAVVSVIALMSSAPEMVKAENSGYSGLLVPRKVEQKKEETSVAEKKKMRNTASVLLTPSQKKAEGEYNWRSQSRPREDTEKMKRVKAYVAELPGESFYAKFKLHDARDAREVLKIIGMPPEHITQNMIDSMRIRYMAGLRGDIFHMDEETIKQLSMLEEFDAQFWEKQKEYASTYKVDRKFLNSLRKFTHIDKDEAERMSYQAVRKKYAKHILRSNEQELERLTDALLVADLGLDTKMRKYVVEEIRAELKALRDNLEMKSDYPLTVDLGRGVPKEVVKQKFEAYQVAISRVNETLTMMDQKYPSPVKKTAVRVKEK